MDIIGLTLFPAVTYNLLYNNISKNYGFLPNIIFRLVITLYVYVVSVVPAIPDSLYGFSKLIIPILILGFINVLYKKKTNIVSVKKAKISNVFFVTTLFIITLLIMLVSNQFKFGTIVIATPSMSGEINTGDVIIYEKIDYDEIITVGQIIVFEKNKTLIVHRVVEIEYIDGTLRYYTKGDANEDIDSGYITKSDIIGITNVKVSYVGYPTLWLTSLFERD
jgi:signal peptidase